MPGVVSSELGFVGIPGYSGFSCTAGIPGTPPLNSGFSCTGGAGIANVGPPGVVGFSGVYPPGLSLHPHLPSRIMVL